MTDVRDREPETKTEAEPQQVDLHPVRQTVVARALAPIRRVTGFEAPAPSGREINLRANQPVVTTLPTSRAFHPIRWSLLVVVLLPTLVFGVYLYLISSDQYAAEARFAVRSAAPLGGSDSSMGSVSGNDSDADGDKSQQQQQPTTTSSASYLSGNSSLGGEDAEIVANYIHSRAIIDDISRTLDIRAIFRRPEADFYARLAKDASEEDLERYWKNMVSVYIEGSSGIVTMSVSAFRREDALLLAKAIVNSSETLVNSLSAKTRADAMKTAEDEVRRSDSEVRFALVALTAFRNKNHFIDPVLASESTSKLLVQLLGDQIEAESSLYVANRTQGPNAPGIGTIRARLDSINRHISDLRDQMAGGKQLSGNLANTLAEFEGLQLKLQFAERMYGFARDGVERARVEAIRQSVYLAVFVPPSLPQEYAFPLRTTDFLMFAAAALMLWLSGLTITASVLDHRL